MTAPSSAGSGWPAPTPDAPVVATVQVPGSKSITNRALVLAAQATGCSGIDGPLHSRDTELMAAGLRALGVGVQARFDGGWLVRPARLRGPARIDCGLAGTVMRFLPPLAAGATGEIVVDGDDAARRRPITTVLDALRALGADIVGDALPFVIRGAGPLPGGMVTIDASASSQFVSGLLLAAPSFVHGVTVRHEGRPVPSLPHIDMTVQMLRSVGVTVDDSRPDVWRVVAGPVRPWTGVVEPDLSNATAFLAAAAVTGGSVTIPHWPSSTTQAGDAFRRIAVQMGCRLERGDSGLTLHGPQLLRGIDIDLHETSELTPTVAAMALFASGPSRLRNIAHIRGHETDRLAALEENIAAIGGSAVAGPDSLTITPTPLRAGRWGAYADHRMATAGAVVGLRIPGVVVDDIACTAKTLPDFEAMWSAMLRPAAADRGVRP